MVLSSPIQDSPEQRGEQSEGLASLMREQSVWEVILSLVDRAGRDWELPQRPGLIDMRHTTGVGRLADGLHRRRVSFVVEISGSLPVAATCPRVPGEQSTVGGPLPARTLTLTRAETRRAMVWTDPGTDTPHRTYVTVCPVWLPGCSNAAQAVGSSSPTGRWGSRALRGAPLTDGPYPGGGGLAATEPTPFHLVSAWTASSDRPIAMWLTNLPPTRIDHGLSLAALSAQRLGDVAELGAEYGLLDFEGRSFRGWHHHTTLVSAAYAFAKLHLGARMMDLVG